MAGSVVHRGGNHWELRISLGYDSQGKQIRRTKRITATSERTARKELDKFYLETINAPRERIKGDMTFGEFSKIWENRYNATLALITRAVYTHRLNGHIMEMFKDIPLKKITVEKILYFVGKLRNTENGVIKDKKLSRTSVYMEYRLLKQMLDKAVAWGYLNHNPCKEIPKDEKPRPDYHHYPIWQENELKKFLSIVEALPDKYHNVKYKTMFYTAIMTGLRLGELTGLAWDSVDFTNHIITVVQSQKYLNAKINEISDPKTKSSVRKVYFDSYIEELLKLQKRYQEEYLQSTGYKNPCGYVFLSNHLRYGKAVPVTPSSFRGWLKKLCKKHKLPTITVHSLRHMAATYALSHGAPITAVQSMLGHTNLQTTSIYLHMLDTQQKEPARVLASHLQKLRDKANE